VEIYLGYVYLDISKQKNIIFNITELIKEVGLQRLGNKLYQLMDINV
jgi:hypothetical protein